MYAVARFAGHIGPHCIHGDVMAHVARRREVGVTFPMKAASVEARNIQHTPLTILFLVLFTKTPTRRQQHPPSRTAVIREESSIRSRGNSCVGGENCDLDAHLVSSTSDNHNINKTSNKKQTIPNNKQTQPIIII